MGVVKMYRFNGNRYLTKGIKAEIPLDLQLILWFLLDEQIKSGLELDYLQVFALSPYPKDGAVYQKIVHSQEIPPRKREKILNVFDKPISEKIYIIDSLEYVTMLIASEY